MTNIEDAIDILELAKMKEPRALVALSGGKDSLVVLDLAIKVYGKKNLQFFNLEFLPGMQANEDLLAYPKKRFGINEIQKYPHEGFLRCYKNGYFTWESNQKDMLPNIGRNEMYDMIARVNKVNTVITGLKRIDQFTTALQVKWGAVYGGVVTPIYQWRTDDVLDYLKGNKIDLPDIYVKGGSRGVGISYETIKWLDEFYPEDMKVMESYFPFCRAVVFRKEKYGTGAKERRV